MYKKLILILVLSLVIVGCQNQGTANPDDVLKMTQRQERRIGVLQSLGGAYTSAQATHLLRMEDGTNIYLKSDYIKLDDEKYNNKQVEVMGEIIRTTDSKQLMNVNSIDVLDIESSTTDELPQWVDYDSTALDLNLKYRDDYELSEKNMEINIIKSSKSINSLDMQVDEDDDSSSDLKVATISIKKLSSDPANLASLMKVESLSNADILAEGFTRSKVTQKAIDAYKKSTSENVQIFYYLRAGSGVYAISFTAGDNQDDIVAEQNMFYDILASVDFHDLYEESSMDESTTTNEGEDYYEDAESENDEIQSEEINTESTTGINEVIEDDSVTVESQGNEITGFTTFASESAGFAVQYPKSYYFGSAALSNNAYRTYEFGSEPLEESPGDIILDIVKGDVPDGKTTTFGGVTMTTVDNGNIISIYVKKDNDVYKVTGPSNKEKILKQMASTIENK